MIASVLSSCSVNKKRPSTAYADNSFQNNTKKQHETDELNAIVSERDRLKKKLDELELENMSLRKSNQALSEELKRAYSDNKNIALATGAKQESAIPAMDATELLKSMEEDAKNGKSSAPSFMPDSSSYNNYTLLGAIKGSEKSRLTWVTLGSYPSLSDAKILKQRLAQIGLDVYRLKIVGKEYK